MRWLVVGSGSIGRRHLRNLRARGERDLVAVRRAGGTLDGDLADVTVAASIEDGRGRGPAVAIICTPTALHVDAALAALRVGCHVLIEKPLADRVDRVAELAAAAESGGLIVGVAHCFRFDGILDQVRTEIASEAGVPLSVAVWCGQHLADWHPDRDHRATYSARRDLGGGVLLDLVHELDYVDWLFGPVEEVAAEVRNTGTLGIETEDVADVMLRVRRGEVVTCHLDYLARPPVRGGRLVSGRGTLAWDLLAGTVGWLDARGPAITQLPGWRRDEMYRAELAAFSDAVSGGPRYPIGLEEGARAVRIALAAREAARTGRRVAP
jgi:predicted dehydrogenase